MSRGSEAVKRWRKNTKRKLILAFGGACQICGYNKCDEVFEFHHLDPSIKETHWGKLRSNIKSIKTVLEELKKCVMLCSNCHKEYHAGYITLPTNMKTIDDAEISSILNKVDDIVPKDTCPICTNLKPVWQQTCSLSCGYKLAKGRKIEWEKYDIATMALTMTYTQIAETVGCSVGAVSKYLQRVRKLK